MRTPFPGEPARARARIRRSPIQQLAAAVRCQHARAVGAQREGGHRLAAGVEGGEVARRHVEQAKPAVGPREPPAVARQLEGPALEGFRQLAGPLVRCTRSALSKTRSRAPQ
jgi:hypothetical protein